ncbi:MAG: hypothetical protein ACI4IT_03530 [Oscillospiraceae bacterium]
MDRRFIRAEAENCVDMVNYIMYILSEFFAVKAVVIESAPGFDNEVKIFAETQNTIEDYKAVITDPKHRGLKYSLSQLGFVPEEREGFLLLSCYKSYPSCIGRKRLFIKMKSVIEERFPEKKVIIRI